jgi:hypothetical protein
VTIEVGTKVRVHPEALRCRSVRIDRGMGTITKIHPGSSYGVWPAFLVVRWENGQTTDIHVKNIYVIGQFAEVDISRCPLLQEMLT